MTRSSCRRGTVGADTGSFLHCVGPCRSRRHSPGALLRTLVAPQRSRVRGRTADDSDSEDPTVTSGGDTVVALAGDADVCARLDGVTALARVIGDTDGAVVDLAGMTSIDTGVAWVVVRAWQVLADRRRAHHAHHRSALPPLERWEVAVLDSCASADGYRLCVRPWYEASAARRHPRRRRPAIRDQGRPRRGRQRSAGGAVGGGSQASHVLVLEGGPENATRLARGTR